jgi:hypothetical protein
MYKHNEESLIKMSDAAKKRKGTKYIHHPETKEVMRVYPSEIGEWESKGWVQGKGYTVSFIRPDVTERSTDTIWVRNIDSGERKRVPKEEVYNYLQLGWILGTGIIMSGRNGSKKRQKNEVYLFHPDLGSKLVSVIESKGLLNQGWIPGRYLTGYLPFEEAGIYLLSKIQEVDQEALMEYLRFVSKASLLEGFIHHILPVSLFPEYSNLKAFPWNSITLSYQDHVQAHFLLYKALRLPETWYALAQMVNVWKKLRMSDSPKDLEIMFKELLPTLEPPQFDRTESSRKISEALKGYQPSPESHEKRIAAIKEKTGYGSGMGGKKHSEESKVITSASMKRFYEEHPEEKTIHKPRGEDHVFFGKERDPETRKKISEALTGKKQSEETKRLRGESLSKSLVGIEYCHNPETGQVRKVKGAILEELKSQGWLSGRPKKVK